MNFWWFQQTSNFCSDKIFIPVTGSIFIPTSWIIFPREGQGPPGPFRPTARDQDQDQALENDKLLFAKSVHALHRAKFKVYVDIKTK